MRTPKDYMSPKGPYEFQLRHSDVEAPLFDTRFKYSGTRQVPVFGTAAYLIANVFKISADILHPLHVLNPLRWQNYPGLDVMRRIKYSNLLEAVLNEYKEIYYRVKIQNNTVKEIK